MYKKKNLAKSTLAAQLLIAGTTATIQTGDGTKFPAVGATNTFVGVIWGSAYLSPESDATREFVVAYRQTGGGNEDKFTLTRAQEGTSAKQWESGDNFMLTASAAVLDEYESAIGGKQDTLTFGIADTNKVQINAADVADNDFAKFTATGLEGRSYSEVLSDIGAAPTTAASTSGAGLAPQATAPAANILNVLGIANGETVYTNKSILEQTTNPSTQAFGDAAAKGTSLAAAHADHKHAMMAAPTSVTGNAGTATAAASQVITDNAIVTVDAADVADNDYAKFTANGVEGRSYSEVLSDIGAEASGAAATHSALTTGVHGVGAGTVAKTADITATKLDDFATPDNNTDLNANTTNHGLLLQATAPAAGLTNVVAIENGETVYKNKALFSTTHPSDLGTAAEGSGVTAARIDHVHTLPKLDDMAAPEANTDLNASTTAHGLVVAATAPAAGLINVVGIANAETAYTNKALFDATAPSTQAYGDAAAVGSAVVAAKRDHKHAMPAAYSLADEAVTNAKLAHIATSTIKGRVTAATGDVEDLTAANVRTIINVADGATANTKATKAEQIAGSDDAKFLTSLSAAELHQLPEGYMLNGKIVPSVTSNNLTVALKGKDGNDPSATNPVYAMIGGVLRSITSALSITKNAGTNWCNAGSAELATKEIDYFVYLGYNATDGVVIGFSRIPSANRYYDFSATTTNEKYCAISTISHADTGDYYGVIGRFGATLSATASFNWSVPTFTPSSLIQRPIYTSRLLDYNAVGTAASGTMTAQSFSYSKYRMVNGGYELYIRHTVTTVGTATSDLIITLPFINVYEMSFNGVSSSTGKTLRCLPDAGVNTVEMRDYNNVTIFASGAISNIFGYCEI
jgi:hypothetical protein